MTHRADPEALLEAALAELPAGPLLLLLSGGLDSSALLHALSCSPGARARGVSALHVDHALHPDSGLWAAHCVRAAEACAIPIRVVRVAVGDHAGLGLEAAARRARYAAVSAAMAPGAIALAAHHADDQAETVLMRLVRGAGPRALGGMRALRALAPGWLARPWLGLPRAAIRGYASRHGLEWLDDPSNAVLRHDRNFLRAEVLSRLRERWPDAAQGIGRSATLLREAGRHLARRVELVLAECIARDGTLRTSALAALDEFLLAEVLRRWIAGFGLSVPPARVLARVRPELLESRSDKVPRLAWRGGVLRRHRDRLHAMAPLRPVDPGWEREWDGTAALELPPGLGLVAFAPPAALPFRVGLRRGGERIDLGNGRPSQSLKHLLQERGVPPWERARVPLLWHGDELWAAGDSLRAHRFDAWLRERGTRYLWHRFALTGAGP